MALLAPHGYAYVCKGRMWKKLRTTGLNYKDTFNSTFVISKKHKSVDEKHDRDTLHRSISDN